MIPNHEPRWERFGEWNWSASAAIKTVTRKKYHANKMREHGPTLKDGEGYE
jgi:hypothetical protein